MKPQSSSIFFSFKGNCLISSFISSHRSFGEQTQLWINQGISKYCCTKLWWVSVKDIQNFPGFWTHDIKRGNGKLNKTSIKKDWGTPFQNFLWYFSFSFLSKLLLNVFLEKCLIFNKFLWAGAKTFHWKMSVYFWSASHLTETMSKSTHPAIRSPSKTVQRNISLMQVQFLLSATFQPVGRRSKAMFDSRHNLLLISL